MYVRFSREHIYLHNYGRNAHQLFTKPGVICSLARNGPRRHNRRLDDEDSEEFGTAHGDARDVVIDIMPPRPDLLATRQMATRQLTTPNVIRQSTDTVRTIDSFVSRVAEEGCLSLHCKLAPSEKPHAAVCIRNFIPPKCWLACSLHTDGLHYW